MKKEALAIVIFLLLALPVLVVAGTARVITEVNVIRKDCRFYAPVVGQLKHGDALDILSKEGDWLTVRFGAVEGCVHKSAIEKQAIAMPKLKGAGTGRASAEEVTLAGKGFNPQVESKYRSSNPNLRYDEVDRIESYVLPGGDFNQFVKNGGLKVP